MLSNKPSSAASVAAAAGWHWAVAAPPSAIMPASTLAVAWKGRVKIDPLSSTVVPLPESESTEQQQQCHQSAQSDKDNVDSVPSPRARSASVPTSPVSLEKPSVTSQQESSSRISQQRFGSGNGSARR
ncbi:hypothetical protein HDU76_004827, partial [Blyttiomyces sp. JEL0837]